MGQRPLGTWPRRARRRLRLDPAVGNPGEGMVRRLVELSLRLQAAVILAAVVLIGIGLCAYAILDIEAYPAPVPPRVDTIVPPPGRAAEGVEHYAPSTLGSALTGMPGLD